MSENSTIRISTVSESLLLGLALAMPLYKKAVPALVVFLGVSLLVDALRYRQFSWRVKSTPMLSLLGLFVLLAFGYTKSEHMHDASTELIIKLSFLVFPLYLCFVSRLSEALVRKAFDYFMYGALLFAPIAMLLGLFKSVAYHDWGYLTYQELGLYFHPTYIATYEAWAFFMLAAKWWRGEWLFGKLGLHALSLLVVLVFVALLASKAGFIAMLIAIAFATYDGLKRRAGLARSAVFASLSVVVFAVFIVVTPASLARLDAALPVKQEAPITVGGNPLDPGNLPGAHSSSELRLVTWKTSWNLLLQHPFGVGTGNSTPSMVAAYKDQGEEYAAFRELNAHNQFLQTGVELGWPGILMLCIFLGSGLWYSYRHKQTVVVLFYILLGMNFLFESFLEVQAGIIFTAFIVWLVSAAPAQALQSSVE